MEISLTDQQQRLVDNGAVILADKKSEDIPEDMRLAVLRGFGGNFGNKGLACTLLREDGKVVIVLDGEVTPSLIRHEFIHAAQCFVGNDVISACLEAAVKQGRLLANAIEYVLSSNPSLAHDHRDYERTLSLWRSHADGTACSTPMVDFEFYQDLYPTTATAKLAAETLGFSYPRGAYAALTGYLCSKAGFVIDPSSDMASEIVAYTFECLDSFVLDDLMSEAALIAESKLKSDIASCSAISSLMACFTFPR